MSALDLCASCQRTFGHAQTVLVHEACVEAGGLSLARAIAAEREACAQICADVARQVRACLAQNACTAAEANGADECAERIRARST